MEAHVVSLQFHRDCSNLFRHATNAKSPEPSSITVPAPLAFVSGDGGQAGARFREFSPDARYRQI
jgi:hypothetical protein